MELSMKILIACIVTFFIFWILWWWFVGRNSPKYPPLNIDSDDPDIVAATVIAKETFEKFRDLYLKGNMDYQVKIPFETSSGVVEHLWAAVLKLENDQLEVRYLTPPTSHQGVLERVNAHNVSEISDWVVFNKAGTIYGGYTQRVMFKKAREQWGKLPAELAEQEKKYV
jgi:uncharacterized protein YegJ (DUF2314 family)